MIRIGVDLGGTQIKVGAVSDGGQLLCRSQAATGAARPFAEVIRAMAGQIRGLTEQMGLDAGDIASIGVGLPGVADDRNGRAINCTNLGWLDAPIRDELRRYFDCPVRLENDANAAALAENRVGVSAGCESSVLITLGTGVGSGIVLKGRIWPGFHGMAGEVGHMTLVAGGLPCNCGRRGCVERYCSATALVEQARHACLTRPDNAILRAAQGRPEAITGKMVVDAAKAGDETALRIFTEFARYLALTIDGVINFLNPEMIVLGGGLSWAGAFLLDAVRGFIPPYEMGQERPVTRVALAALGNEAGMIGAAMLGMEGEEDTL